MQKRGQQTIFIILQALPVMFSQGQVPKQETSDKSALRWEITELTWKRLNLHFPSVY